MIDGGSTRHLATVHSSALIAVRNENLPSRSPSMSRYCCMRTDHAVAILSLSLSLSSSGGASSCDSGDGALQHSRFSIAVTRSG